MKKAKLISLLLALAMILSLAAVRPRPRPRPRRPRKHRSKRRKRRRERGGHRYRPHRPGDHREAGLVQRVVCIGAGALRLYSYIGDVSLLCGVEDIDNETLSERPEDVRQRCAPLRSRLRRRVCVPALVRASAGRTPRAPRPKRFSPASRTSSSPSTAMRIRPTPCRSSSVCRS